MTDMGMSTISLDVTDAESIERCHAEVAKLTGGRLDILVNNAGRTHTHPATDLDMDDVRYTFESNVFGTMAMVKAFVDLLIAARGLIINTASLSSITPYFFGSAYCATKGAIVSYSRTLRLELAPFGVRVMCTMTGTTRSNTASHGHRVLPPDSLYQRVRDLFQWRLTFSQTRATMPTEQYAHRLVTDSLKPEWPLILRRWFGRPDWFWYGGMAGATWFGHSLGEWLIDTVCWRLFQVYKLQNVLEDEKKRKKLQ
ncbi:NADPH-dependent 1-acyl dihydroxyacetone phosphate reductase [Diatrype stigma]|uniref:NADPH-dependent 1-acyl dihydroxyacetone phosphate reductase n=1 Tax=Diatrype stigma TaxID=117547 RepID=A0AAN9V267_9PEZI